MAFFIAWGVYAVITFRKKSLYSFSFFYFIITMSVVSNFVILIGSTLGERFLLIPSLAFCISILFLAGKITQTDFPTAPVKKMLPFLSIIAVILVLYSFKTITRNRNWNNNLSLFEADVQSAPNSMRTHSSLGFEYYSLTQTLQDPAQKEEYYNKAKKEFGRSIEICPKNQYALYNYGVMEYHFGKLENALDLYSRAVKVDSNDYNSWNDLSVITFQLDRYDSSLRYFTKLLQFKQDDSRVIEAIGVIHARKKEYGLAREWYEKALAIDPAQEITYNNLIQVCSLQGDTAGARYYSGLKTKNIR
jgi:tetratricopeptide (TPR) repeat protein